MAVQFRLAPLVGRHWKGRSVDVRCSTAVSAPPRAGTPLWMSRASPRDGLGMIIVLAVTGGLVWLAWKSGFLGWASTAMLGPLQPR